MAIVQRFQRPLAPLGRGERRPIAAKPDLDKLFQTVIQAADTLSTEVAAEPPRDHDTACDILDRAAQAFDGMTQRAKDLETALAEAQAKLDAETARIDTMTDDWTRLSDSLRDHARDCEQRLAEMTTRAETAEASLAEALARAEAAEQNFSALQTRSTRLHDKVVASFGIGSRAQLLVGSAPAGMA